MLKQLTKVQPLSSSCNEHLLQELSCEESSVYIGGFNITNNTDLTQTFYPFSSTRKPKVQSLGPQKTGEYGTDYLLYNTSQDGFAPALYKIDDPGGDYEFYTNAGNTDIRGIGPM